MQNLSWPISPLTNNFLKFFEIPMVRNRKKLSIVVYRCQKYHWNWKYLSWMNIYVKYINGNRETINTIFYSYLNSNTKNHCHRKQNLIQSSNIKFTSVIKLDCCKDLFLSKVTIKKTFKNLLTVCFSASAYWA